MNALPGQDSSLDGTNDLARAVDRLARRLPEPLFPLARIAYNYRWSWTPGGRELFRHFGTHRFNLSNENPVRFLRDLPERSLLDAATDDVYLARLNNVVEVLDDDLARPARTDLGDGPVAFLCAEFGVHRSLPVYSGGLGVLAGDLLKEASDQALPLVGVGLFYRKGYFHQRVDRSGWQHEYWTEVDPEALPAVRVTTPNGSPLAIRVPIWDGHVTAHVWRIDLGRVPLYLLDAEIAENSPLQRWVSARLYEGNRSIRLAQYALLGVGAVRALDAMSITPALFHLNEGHAALATLAVASQIARSSEGPVDDLRDALERVRDHFVFTTHTPVQAGNETYSREEILPVLGSLADELHFDREVLLELGRVHPSSANEPSGLTQLAIHVSRSTNAVSARHGYGRPRDVARDVPTSGARPSAHRRTSPTQCTFRPGWPRRCGRCSPGTSAEVGNDTRQIRRSGRASTRSPTRNSGPCAANKEMTWSHSYAARSWSIALHVVRNSISCEAEPRRSTLRSSRSGSPAGWRPTRRLDLLLTSGGQSLGAAQP